MKKITEHEADFEIECLPEDIPVRGNAMSSGDPAVDREVEDWVIDQLDRGNEWAWCTVKVTARWGDFEGTAFLGASSYKNLADFKRDGYYSDMKKAALDDLNEKVRAAYEGTKGRFI